MPETHLVWTEDGYCLEVHRVLPPKSPSSTLCEEIVNNERISTDTNPIEVKELLRVTNNLIVSILKPLLNGLWFE